LARLPTHRLTASDSWSVWKVLGVCALTVFLVAQVTTATRFGLTNGRAIRTSRRGEADLFVHVNPDKIPLQSLSNNCKIGLILLRQPEATLRDAAEDHLGEFDPPSYRYYRPLKPPLLDGDCPNAAGVGGFS
jgi:hypothetical protein